MWRHRLQLSALFGPVPRSPTVWGAVAVLILVIDLFSRAELALLVPWLERTVPALADWYRINAVGDLPSGTWAYVVRVTPPVLLAPLVEETFFRGLFYQRWAHS